MGTSVGGNIIAIRPPQTPREKCSIHLMSPFLRQISDEIWHLRGTGKEDITNRMKRLTNSRGLETREVLIAPVAAERQ